MGKQKELEEGLQIDETRTYRINKARGTLHFKKEEVATARGQEGSGLIKGHFNMQNTNIMASSPITSWQIDGERTETVRDYFFGLQNHCSHEIKKTLARWKNSYDMPRQFIKKQRYHFADKGLSSQSYGFSSSHVWM